MLTLAGTALLTGCGGGGSVGGASPLQPIVLNFDSLSGCNYLNGSPIPAASRLSNQYVASYGIAFSSSGGYVAVTADPAAVSPPNAITGSTASGLVSYSPADPITFTFFNPKNPTENAAVSMFAAYGDTDGTDPNNVTIQAYDVNDNLIGTYSTPDTGGEKLFFQFPTAVIHKVVFLGSSDSNGVSLDNVTFTPPVVPQ